MITKSNFRLVKIIVAVIILVATIVTVSCNINTEYQKVTVTKGGVRFSFEYPSSYQDKNHTLYNDVTGSFLLKRVNDANTWDNSDTSLFGFFNTKYPSAQAFLDALLQDLKTADSSNQIKILENSEVMVGGVEGDLVYYSAEYGKRPHFLTYVFFDYKGQTCSLNIDALGTVSEQAKSEFNHIIESFEFLD
jgi:hypothetical protein